MKTKAIILAAGQGTRMKSDLPKALHPICGRPMISILLDTVRQEQVDEVVVVVGPHMEAISEAVTPYPTVVQEQRLGTAHAVLTAESALQPFDGFVFVLYGDTVLIKPETLNRMIQEYQSGSDVVVVGFTPADARRYGRLIVGSDGLEAIVEYKDATDAQRAIRLCNSGVMGISGRHILSLLKQVKNNNAAGEYYLTDVVQIARSQGLKCSVVIGDVEELHGVNTPEELETAQEIYARRQEQADA